MPFAICRVAVPVNPLRLVPMFFLLYQFSLLLFVACFTVVFAVENDCQKRNLIGTDHILIDAPHVHA